MEVQILKNIITKLKISDIFHVLDRWTFLSDVDKTALKSSCKSKQTKRLFASSVADLCLSNGGLTMETLGELDLISTQMYSTKKLWNAYHLTEKQGNSSARKKTLSPEEFKRELKRLLKLYFTTVCTASVMLHNGLLWGRVYIPRPGQKQYQSTRCLYFVHYPQTPVIIMNGMKAAFEIFLSQCLVLALGYKDITEMSLNGHDMESVAELAINKFCNGGYSKFLSTHRPDGEVRSRKRKEPEIEEHERVTCENSAEKRRRLAILDNSFGVAVQPTLEKVEYKVELPYRGQGIATELRNEEEVFSSRVRFHGKSVLEGIRNLGAKGFASVPLPKHLTCVPSRARNYFLLAKKQQTSQSQETTDRGVNQPTRQHEQKQAVNQTSPVRVQHRTPLGSASQRKANRTAKPLIEKSQIANDTTSKEAKMNKNHSKHAKQQTKQKILRENQSLNVTRNSDTLSESKGKKNYFRRKENVNVHKQKRPQQKHSKRKSRQ